MGNNCPPRPETTVDAGSALDLLSREERRDVVDVCRRQETLHLRIDELADHVAERSRRRGGPARADRIEAALHHVHLPRLAERGVLEYDRRNGDVRYAGDERLEACLDRILEV